MILDTFTVVGMIASAVVITLLVICACKHCKLCTNKG